MVSGINGGLNAGINVLYSGTVAAAIEGAFFGITSIAVSLEFDEHADVDEAARLARQVIEQIIAQKGSRAATLQPEHSDRGRCRRPRQKCASCRWAWCATAINTKNESTRAGGVTFGPPTSPPPPPGEHETDLTALRKGYITLTPLHFDLTEHRLLAKMEQWKFDLRHT